jgi:hypothetical protein
MTWKQSRILEDVGQAEILVVQGRFPVHSVAIHGCGDGADGVALTLTWFDDNGDAFAADFTAGGLSRARVIKGELELVDMAGESVRVKQFVCNQRPFSLRRGRHS